MEDLFEGFFEDVTKWENIKNIIDLDVDISLRNDHKTVSSVQLLPRRDVMLYGTIPKMEQRIYTKCKECRLVFNPKDILSHKSCPGKYHSSTHNLKSKSTSAKKFHSNLPPPPLFKKSSSPITCTATVNISDIPLPKVSSPKTKISTISAVSSTITTTMSSPSKSETRISLTIPSSLKPSLHSSNSSLKSLITTSEHSKSKTSEHNSSSTSSSSSSSGNSSSKHKKSRKSNSSTKITKDYDPDVHCGVVEGSWGPCTRSITCSNHRIQLRKLVPGRSKDIHQLIAERKIVKDKELKHSSTCSYTSPNGQVEEKESFSQNTTYVPVAAAVIPNGNEPPDTSHLMPIVTKINEVITPTPPRQTTSVVAVQQPNLTETEIDKVQTINNNYITNTHSQENEVGTVPVVYTPMSLVSFVQIGKNVICLESPQSAQTLPVTEQSVFLKIPNTPHLNIDTYKSHPKPVAVPNFGAKKVGGAILLSNQRLECQRNDILMAINTKRKTINNTQNYRAISLLNHTNTPHRPNILKVKSANKVNCKRTSVDKINTCDSKQMRLTKLMGSFCSSI